MKATCSPEQVQALEFDEEFELATQLVHAFACASEYVFAGHVYLAPIVHALPVGHCTIDTFSGQWYPSVQLRHAVDPASGW